MNHKEEVYKVTSRLNVVYSKKSDLYMNEVFTSE